MKILLVAPIGHRVGGVFTDTALLCNALAELGSDVTLTTFDGLLANLDSKVKHIAFCSKAGIFAPMYRWLEKVLGFKKLFELHTWMDTFLTVFLALRLAKKEKYDAIHIIESHPLMLPLFSLGIILRDSSLVLTVRCTRYTYDRKEWSNRFCDALKNRHFRLCRGTITNRLRESTLIVAINNMLYRKAVKQNQLAFICESEGIKESYKSTFLQDKFTCIPIGIPERNPLLTQAEARQHLNLPLKGKILLSFGVNHNQKSLQTVFQAVQDLPKDFWILYAGKIDHSLPSNDPQKLAEDYGCRDNAIIVDKFILAEEMKYYFAAADGMIMSYTKEFLHASGVLTLAAGSNLPVIASDVGQLGEFVRSYKLGLTFTPEDPQSLKLVIVAFFKLSMEEKEEMKNNLRAFASTNSCEEIAKKHLELYRSLADDNKKY